MESTSTFCVRFILRHLPGNSTESHIYARVVVNKQRAEIFVNRTIHSSCWNPERQYVRGSKELMTHVNPHLDAIRYKLNDCYQQLKLQEAIVTAESIKKLFFGEVMPYNSLLSLFDYHKLSTKETLRFGTLKNYGSTEKYIRLFLEKKYRAKDIPLANLNYQFITQFELFLRTSAPLQQNNPLTNNGIMKHMERLRKIVTLAFKLEWINKDPFMRYQLKFNRTEREFLIQSEIEQLHDLLIENKKLDRCRDLFLFACYTGLAYTDLANLTKNNIVLGIDGELWVRTFRQKTDTKVNVPLLPQALALLRKYEMLPEVLKENRVLPFLSNQKLNDYLKDIAIKCGILKNMTFHLARHTFATTITLNNGIPIETVSKMLGHTKLSTTQVYVHVLDRKISDDMKGLRDKFKCSSLPATKVI